MNAIKQAFKEVFQAYYLTYRGIVKRWRLKRCIRVANAMFIDTNKQYFVLESDDHDYEVLSGEDLSRRLLILKRKSRKYKGYSIDYFRNKAKYVTPGRIYSGNLNAFGIEVNDAVQRRNLVKRQMARRIGNLTLASR